MKDFNKIPHDLLVRVISAYCEPMPGEAICIPQIVENTLEFLREKGLLCVEHLEDPDAIFKQGAGGAA